jgi:iron-sulfur cluster assembly protein
MNVQKWSKNQQNNHVAPVSLTEAALAHVRKCIAQRPTCVGLKFGVKASGCNGYKYVVDYVDVASGDDYVFPLAQQGLAIYVDKASLPFVAGTTIDYTTQGLNQSFVFRNPNEQGQCGCGESFNVDGAADQDN